MVAVPQAPVTARQALFAIVVLMLLGGFLSGLVLAKPAGMQMLVLFGFGLLASFMPFLWYCRDRDARGYLRSPWLNIGMVSLMLLAVPYYLVRSRPHGQRLRACLRYVGFVLLCAFGELLGTIIGALMAGVP